MNNVNEICREVLKLESEDLSRVSEALSLRREQLRQAALLEYRKGDKVMFQGNKRHGGVWFKGTVTKKTGATVHVHCTIPQVINYRVHPSLLSRWDGK